jgi:hypothetical protein
LHWALDVSFNENTSRKKEGYCVQQFSMINRIALNPLKDEPSGKRNAKGKKPDTGWNNDCLLKNPDKLRCVASDDTPPLFV